MNDRPPSEPDLRREDFRGDVPIRLWDGREWFFPKPCVSGFYPHKGADGALEFIPGFDLGASYDLLTDAYAEEDDPHRAAGILLNLAALLLRRNYRLEDADLRHLLYRVPTTDPRFDECNDMWRSIAEVAFGLGLKKTTEIGSGSSLPRTVSPGPES